MNYRRLAVGATLALLLGGWEARPAAAAETIRVDPGHSHVGFTVRFLGVTKVEGRFTDYSATILYDEKDPAGASITAVIKTASINTDNEARDADLRSSNFFDVEKHPTMVFQSQRVEKTDTGLRVTGTLTLRGVSREITLPFTHARMRREPPAPDAVAFESWTTFKRTDFGILGPEGWRQALMAPVSDDVEIRLFMFGWVYDLERLPFASEGKKSIGELLLNTIQESGVGPAVERYRQLKKEQPDAYDFDAEELNLLGAKLLKKGQSREAVEILKLNTEAFPDLAHAHNRVGDAYSEAGQHEHAAQAYRKALALDPYNSYAMEKLRHLGKAESKGDAS